MIVRSNLLSHSFTQFSKEVLHLFHEFRVIVSIFFTTFREILNDSSEFFLHTGYVTSSFLSTRINTGFTGNTCLSARHECCWIFSHWNCFEWDFCDRNSFYQNATMVCSSNRSLLPLHSLSLNRTAVFTHGSVGNSCTLSFSKEVTLTLILLHVAHRLPIARGRNLCCRVEGSVNHVLPATRRNFRHFSIHS